MNVRFICKQRSSPISIFFPRNAPLIINRYNQLIDRLAILQKGLDRALFLYNFLLDVRSSGVRASFIIVHIRKFYECSKMFFDSDSFPNN